ncbi:uncharacterized protein LOC130240789 [Danio aesculapii]|uniref:uncharacterized protein LOC130240789 n=1 Tax=Danio aesculapii TaxID=1142201 RepID=UPI0024C07A2F|nr:uncharacterized protein LOC130240789 [Danio aesculapii]XP_056328407.1 uncharacterized protein LOC130240789 [Danio aesculapii]
MPSGEKRESMEAKRVALLTEVKKKKKDEAEIKKMMQHTFSRRQEVLQEPAIAEFVDRWPALFDICEINFEFMRLTTVPLTSKFLGELDCHSGKLIEIFNAKGGAAGRKISAIMAQMNNNEDVNVRRDCVMSCLSIYLNEDLDTLVKEYVVNGGRAVTLRELNPLGPEEPEDEVVRVLAPTCPFSARNNNPRLNNKDACSGLSAYELKRLENIAQKEAFLSSLKIWQVVEDLRQSVKPKPNAKRLTASLEEKSLQSPRKSLRSKTENLTPSEGLTHNQDIESREAEEDMAGKTMGIYKVQSEDHGQGDGRFTDVRVVLEGVEVLHNLQSVTHACVMLYGLIYALNLNYPKSLKCTFEVYQKILMDLDSTKLSPKVQTLD